MPRTLFPALRYVVDHLMLLLAEANPYQSILEVNLQEFPFRQCCAYLHKSGASEDLDLKSAEGDRNALLAYLGHIAQDGLKSGEILVRNAVARFVNPTPLIPGLQWNTNLKAHTRSQTFSQVEPYAASEGSQFIRVATPPERRTVPIAQSRHPPMQNTSPPRQAVASVRSKQSPFTRDLAKYTMLLNENAAHCGEDLNWNEKDIGSLRKPRFRISITFRGVSAEGEGSKKKDAKHEAAFRACQKLGLRL